MADFAIFVQKLLISEMVRERAKRMKIWDHIHHSKLVSKVFYFRKTNVT